jgi:hypothetical protein
MEALRWTSLGLWLASWALIVCYWSIPEALANTPEVQQWKPVFRTITACASGRRS